MSKRFVFSTLLGACLFGLTLAGCQSDVDSKLALAGLSSGCRINTDCQAPLVCVFELCHEQCSSSRDCDDGARCVQTEQQRNVCQLPAEAGCSEHGSCPGTQVCGVDAQCRDACASDAECLTEQVCSSGTCAETTEVTETGQLVPSEDRPDAARTPCGFDSDCPAELVCLAGHCAAECGSSSDCAAGETCNAGLCQTPPPAGAGCLRNSDCRKDESCIDAACRMTPVPPAPECAYDSDCPTAGQHCLDGACACECATSDDCARGWACRDACQCVPGRVLQGNVVVTNLAQLRELDDVIEITGQLMLLIPGPLEYHLPSLRKVGVLYAYEHNATAVFDALEQATSFSCLIDCEAPLLKTVGRLEFSSSIIRTVELPALESCGDFSISGSPELARISAPKLSTAKVFRIDANAKLTSVEAPLLGSLERLNVAGSDRLTTLSLPAANPTLSLSITGMAKLERVALPSVTQLSGDVTIGESPLLASLDLAGLESASQIGLYQLPKLSELRLTSLAQLSTFALTNGAGPAALQLPALAKAASITLFSLTGVGSVDAPLLAELGELIVNGTPLTDLTLPVQVMSSHIYVQSNPELLSITLPQLQQVTSFHVGGSPLLSALGFPALVSVGSVTISETGISELDSFNPELDGSLSSAGNLNINENPALPVCAVGALGTALTALGWTGSLQESGNLECTCNGPVCQ